MKPEKIREMTTDELVAKERELVDQLLKLRFQQATGQIENPQKIKQVRKDIARVKTIHREKMKKGDIGLPAEEKEPQGVSEKARK
jgi:large subunit ribosomal protein L29